jgi:hypothetical protein
MFSPLGLARNPSVAEQELRRLRRLGPLGNYRKTEAARISLKETPR